SPEWLGREVVRLSDAVAGRLRRSGLSGRTVVLKVRFADFRTITRSRTMPAPSDNDNQLWAVARELLERQRLGRVPIRLVGVSVSNLAGEEAPVQLPLRDDGAAWAAAVRAADAVRARFGDRAVDRASLAAERPDEAYEEARDAPRLRRERLVEPDER
ncbi:MAG TPA: hypothetical protein VGA45_18915, partial [Actinomycetota bacterium]